MLTGESGPNQATGYVQRLEGNIWFNDSTLPTPGSLADYGGSTPQCLTNDDVIVPSATNFNATWGARIFTETDWPCLTGKTNLGTSYFWPTSAATPGTSDLKNNANPHFVDANRTVVTYLRLQGVTFPAPPTNLEADPATVLDWIQVAPRTRIPAVIAYVKAGFAPRNLLYATAGAGGGRIGAIPVTAITSSGIMQSNTQ
jgi:hypothetical protein